MLAVGLDNFVHRPVLRACHLRTLCCKEPPARHLATSVAVLGASWVRLGCSRRRLGGLSRRLGRCWALSLASWSRPARVLEPLVSMAVTSQALLEPSGRRHRRSWSHLGGVLSAIGAILEASWALLQPSGRCLGRSEQRSADMLNFMVFSMFFIDFPGVYGLS